MGNLGRGPLDNATYQISKLSACGLVQEDFLRFYYIFLCKTADHWGGANFDPRDIIWAILVEVYNTMLHTKYLSSMARGFGQEEF